MIDFYAQGAIGENWNKPSTEDLLNIASELYASPLNTSLLIIPAMWGKTTARLKIMHIERFLRNLADYGKRLVAAFPQGIFA